MIVRIIQSKWFLIATVFTVSLSLITPTTAFAVATATGDATATTNTTLAQRLATRKAELKTKLDANTQKLITSRCKAAQSILKNSQTKIDSRFKKRVEIYDGLSSRLGDLITKLNSSNIDTTQLKSVKTQYDSKVTQLKSDITSYKQAFDDLTAVDCTVDPVGFKATLDSLRSSQSVLIKDAQAIKALQPEISKALSNAKTALTQSKNN